MYFIDLESRNANVSRFTHEVPQRFSSADIDECAMNDTLCDQVCMNTEGGFSCFCMEGYALDEATNQCQGDHDTEKYSNAYYASKNF